MQLRRFANNSFGARLHIKIIRGLIMGAEAVSIERDLSCLLMMFVLQDLRASRLRLSWQM